VTVPDPVIRVVNRQFSSNTYLYRTSVPGECVLIDPGLDREAIDSALADARLVPTAIFLTHGHFDHVGSAEHYRRTYSVDLHLHEADARIARSSNFLMMALKIADRIETPATFVPMADGFTWADGADRVEAVHVPGHTPGSTMLRVNDHVFTGDTVYRDDVWLTELPDGDQPKLVESVLRIWDALPEDAPVHPGHGGGASFGDIKQSNVPLRRLLGLEPRSLDGRAVG
jgi:glyoxylase-like metal-dependent hydrolase (beta-lactamase superfamily II)